MMSKLGFKPIKRTVVSLKYLLSCHMRLELAWNNLEQFLLNFPPFKILIKVDVHINLQ